MRYVRPLKRTLACAIAASLIWTMPGVGLFDALANAGIVSVTIQAPVGGGASMGAVGAGMVNLGALGVPGAGLGPGAGVQLNNTTLVPLGQMRVAPTGNPGLSLPVSAIPTASPSQSAAASMLGPAAPAAVGRASPSAAQTAYPAAPGSAGLAQPGIPAPSAMPLTRDGSGRLLGRPVPVAPRRDENGVAENGPDASESLHAFRGIPNRLNRHFSALKAEFEGRRDAGSLRARGSELGELQGRAAGEAVVGSGESAAASALSRLAEGSAQGPYAQAEAGALKAPTRLSLRPSGSASDLGFVIDESPSPAGAVARGIETAAFGAAAVESQRPSAVEAPAPAPSEAAKPAPAKKTAAWLGLGTAAVMFIASLVVGQVGNEALGAAVPTLIQKTFGDFTVVAQLSIFFTAGSIVGRQFGPMLIERFGLKKSYLVSTGLKAATVSLMAGLLAVGHMTLPLMMLFYAVNGLFSGVSLTAMESVPPSLVGQDPGRLEKFWTWSQTLTEIVGITGPIVTGAVVASMGFLPALLAFPVSMGLALAIVAATLRVPKGFDASRPSASAREPRTEGFLSKISRGARLVWQTPALRYSFLAFTFYMTLNPLLYTMLAPAYGLRLAGAGAEELATGIIGWLTGLYSLGGLLGGFLMMREQKVSDAAKAAMRKEYEAKNGAVSDQEWAAKVAPWERETLRKSMLKWLLAGTAGLASIATLMLPVPALGTLLALPAWLGWLGNLTLPAVALIPFGAAQVVSTLKLRSYFQSRVPDEKEMAEAMGFFGAAATVVDTAVVLAAKFLFQAFAGLTPFAYLAAALVPLGLFYLFLRSRLARASAQA